MLSTNTTHTHLLAARNTTRLRSAPPPAAQSHLRRGKSKQGGGQKQIRGGCRRRRPLLRRAEERLCRPPPHAATPAPALVGMPTRPVRTAVSPLAVSSSKPPQPSQRTHCRCSSRGRLGQRAVREHSHAREAQLEPGSTLRNRKCSDIRNLILQPLHKTSKDAQHHELVPRGYSLHGVLARPLLRNTRTGGAQ